MYEVSLKGTMSVKNTISYLRLLMEAPANPGPTTFKAPIVPWPTLVLPYPNTLLSAG